MNPGMFPLKTKTAFAIFSFVTVIIFPYYIIISGINSSFLNSIIPDLNTIIIPAKLIATLIKFFILIVVSSYYWKLSKITKEINFKKFLIHLTLIVPGILITKINVYQFVTMNFHDFESILSQIQLVVLINILANILFFTGQILFGFSYLKISKNTIVTYRK
ncbi:hypothetical protein [[Flexibacter] sp. ATCC 35103]|uniref:hypothetical protein n=1 Tax=[Flexibacter] sp. ATCC 35103 TaxID=1937528 RepID=UPI0009CC0CDF|nr:hypothetical protein [[Flexibacter] sp. ATCC 35103]OMQ13317.1 hypothetical protein BXU01_02215 [[Flexibacter] sp. ATCC 35103]